MNSLNNSMDQSLFRILTPAIGLDFVGQLNDLQAQLQQLVRCEGYALASLLQARFYLSDAANQAQVLFEHALYQSLQPTGVVSYIEQPPLGGGKVALLLWWTGETVTHREVERLDNGVLAVIHTDRLTYYMQSVRWGSEAQGWNEERQTREAFESHMAQLRQRGLNLKEHCQRTWIYVRDVDRYYAGVVKARNEVFAEEGLTVDTHYITSTGIGGAAASVHSLVAIDFFSVSGLSAQDVVYLSAPEYLNRTSDYGVAFERGTALHLPKGSLYMLSGTASIDSKGECLHRGDVLTQAGRLFLNMEKLLESGGASGLSRLRYLIVYLRDVADYAAIQRYLKCRFPHVPYLITEARVCRPEWLIEVEAMAE